LLSTAGRPHLYIVDFHYKNASKIYIMRQIFSILLLTVIASSSFCQQLSSEERLTKPETDYLKKAHHQRILGNVLTWSGVGVLGGSILMNHFANSFLWESTDKEKQENFQEFVPLYVTGTVLLGTGVGFLIAASNNRDKAAAVSVNLKMESSRQVKNAMATTISFPSLTVRLGF
jgi:hypothetical protein